MKKEMINIMQSVEKWREKGESYQECANTLNRNGVKTPRNKQWTAQGVCQYFKYFMENKRHYVKTTEPMQLEEVVHQQEQPISLETQVNMVLKLKITEATKRQVLRELV